MVLMWSIKSVTSRFGSFDLSLITFPTSLRQFGITVLSFIFLFVGSVPGNCCAKLLPTPLVSGM